MCSQWFELTFIWVCAGLNIAFSYPFYTYFHGKAILMKNLIDLVTFDLLRLLTVLMIISSSMISIHLTLKMAPSVLTTVFIWVDQLLFQMIAIYFSWGILVRFGHIIQIKLLSWDDNVSLKVIRGITFGLSLGFCSIIALVGQAPDFYEFLLDLPPDQPSVSISSIIVSLLFVIALTANVGLRLWINLAFRQDIAFHQIYSKTLFILFLVISIMCLIFTNIRNLNEKGLLLHIVSLSIGVLIPSVISPSKVKLPKFHGQKCQSLVVWLKKYHPCPSRITPDGNVT